MIEVVLHERWTTDKSYGSGRDRFRGTVVFWVGGSLLESRYFVYESCVTLQTSLINGDKRYSVVGEVGWDIEKDSPVPKEDVERYINTKLARVIIMAIDGR